MIHCHYHFGTFMGFMLTADSIQLLMRRCKYRKLFSNFMSKDRGIESLFFTAQNGKTAPHRTEKLTHSNFNLKVPWPSSIPHLL